MSVDFKFTSDDAEVIKALENMSAMMQKLREENRKLKEEAKKGSEEVKKGMDVATETMDFAISSAGEYAASMLDIGKAVQFVVNEIKSLHEVQDRAADSARKLAGEQRAFLRNLGNVPEADRSAALSEIKRISSATGVDEATLYSAASGAESARAGLSRKAWSSALEQAARVAPDNAGELDASAVSILRLMKLTGSESGPASTGFMAAMGAQTSIKNLEFINKNLIPAAIGVSQYGGSAAEAAAVVDTLTQLSGDQTGATSGTASLAMAKQLADMLPEKDRFDYDAKGRRKLAAKGTGFTSTRQRIEALQKDPRLRERFFATATFEQTQRPFVSQLVGDKSALDLFTSNIGSFPTSEAALAASGEQYISGLNATPIQQQANMERKLQQTKDAMRLANLKQGDASILATEVTNILAETQMGALQRAIVDWGIRDETGGFDEFGKTAKERAIHYLENRRKELTGKTANVSGPMMGFMKETIDKEKQAEYLKEMIEFLKAINEEQKSSRPANINAHTE